MCLLFFLLGIILDKLKAMYYYCVNKKQKGACYDFRNKLSQRCSVS